MSTAIEKLFKKYTGVLAYAQNTISVAHHTKRGMYVCVGVLKRKEELHGSNAVLELQSYVALKHWAPVNVRDSLNLHSIERSHSMY